VAKTRAWEENHGLSFTYDGVPLLAMLDEYVMLRQEKEEEKKKMRVSVDNFIVLLEPFSATGY
jgi:protein regulator of cytokinesis 1